ncbi:hypothetical protein HanPI659440_Chr08g0292391 [Helianthus annuus]|nr:hypothetical protein HanPI659440_Chr08g0292391 [Helianthus annuus]
MASSGTVNGNSNVSFHAGIQLSSIAFVLFIMVSAGNVTLGSKMASLFIKMSGFLTYPQPPLALNIPCITQRDLP